jgi:exodeoxyribonuclease VII small subunit
MTNETTPASSLTDKEREAIAQMPYEEARDQLIQAVQALEAGGLNLDQSMRQWELGEALAKRAQSLLSTGGTGHCGQYRWHARQSGLSISKYRQYSISMTVRHTFLQGVIWRTVMHKFRISSFRYHTRPDGV